MDGFRIVSIDPGTNALGLAVLEIDIPRGNPIPSSYRTTVRWLDSMTLDCERQSNAVPLIREIHGDRMAKLYGIELFLLEYFSYWQPHCIASESPYMGRFPQAYAALTECLFAIRKATVDYDNLLTLNLIDPATVKQSIGVSGKSGDKNLVRSAVERITTTFILNEGVCIPNADEHAVDALAVGIAHLSAQGLLRL